ncbi:usher protein [Stenotrophomonas sp. ZAC14D2_NAIMI4_7]|uniref:TcfC E-set like domain-containing protein n=1 Tax=Stenotrophomonas sp. ZAC14D2_NAIMI4_7 TaxID=2072405 RepID=UPI000D54295C|nr:TcfC E-set like domain-containing protein [Stenotrophomonas sp. ZAC14D2_NAIMI4_7]AWH19005.1 usher protein [Stenotrophomonas sp. ZAC14D2_NAIMI4_7]
MKNSAPAVTRLAVALALALAAPAVVARNVPPGFEDLVEGQLEQLDIRLPGRSAGLSPVLVTLDTVQLQAPAEALQALDLSPEAQAALLPALSQPLPRNSHRACRHGQESTGCGYLPPPEEPDGVRAIYDEGQGAIVLFFAPQWLPVDDPAAHRFRTVTANAQNAFIHQHVLNVSGGDGYQALAAQGTGTLGVLSDGHVGVEWNYSRQQQRHQHTRDQFQIDSAYYRNDLGQQHYLQAGRMDRRNLASPQGGTFGFSMLPLDRFQGLRLGTTQAYLDPDGAVDALPVTVLLARNARVDAFDGDRLLQTFYLEAGVNQLDTRRFPFGSYTVTLRIYEDGVLVRSEDAPFNKGGDWTDTSVQWFLQAGRRHERRDDGFNGEMAAQAGIRIPFARDLAMTVGVADMSSASYGELRVDARRQFRTQEYRGSASVLRGSDGSHGVQSQLSYRRWASWNVYHQRLRGAACQRTTPSLERIGCVDALSVSVALPLAGGNVYMGYTRRQTYRPSWVLPGSDDDRWQALPGVLPPPGFIPELRPAYLSRALQASYSRSQRWRDFNLGLRAGVWQQRNEGSSVTPRDRGVFLSFTLSRLQVRGGNSHQHRYALDVRQPQHARPDVQYNAGQTYRRDGIGGARELSLDLRGNNQDRYSAGISGQLQGAHGQTSGAASWYQQRNGNQLSYSASHTSGLALTANGLFWGGQSGADAGLAVQVADTDDLDLTGVAAELQVGGLRRQRLRIGERRLLPLAAYQVHRAEVQDATVHDGQAAVRVGSGGGAQPLFLAPGKVARMPVPLEVTYTFIGNARDIAGIPVGGARILNAPVPAVGPSGGFVADFPRRETTLYLLRNEQLLQCPLQVRERRSVVLLVGTVQCEPLAVAQLPPAIRQQARVQRLLQENALIAATPQTAAVGETK